MLLNPLRLRPSFSYSISAVFNTASSSLLFLLGILSTQHPKPHTVGLPPAAAATASQSLKAQFLLTGCTYYYRLLCLICAFVIYQYRCRKEFCSCIVCTLFFCCSHRPHFVFSYSLSLYLFYQNISGTHCKVLEKAVVLELETSRFASWGLPHWLCGLKQII